MDFYRRYINILKPSNPATIFPALRSLADYAYRKDFTVASAYGSGWGGMGESPGRLVAEGRGLDERSGREYSAAALPLAIAAQ